MASNEYIEEIDSIKNYKLKNMFLEQINRTDKRFKINVDYLLSDPSAASIDLYIF